MAHVLVYYTLLVVIIICVMFVKLRKCWRMLQSAVSLGTPENSAVQKLSIIIINPFTAVLDASSLGKGPIKVPNVKSLRPFPLRVST